MTSVAKLYACLIYLNLNAPQEAAISLVMQGGREQTNLLVQ